MSEVFPDEISVQKVVIPYTPRAHFVGMHKSAKRWKFVVAHRRAGKSVAEINEMIKRAMQNTREFPHPRYAYVGPSFAQTKDLIWGYLKHYAGSIPGVVFSESDLQCKLPNGATITLYGGAAAYERMRGLYFDGIVLDEYPLLNPSVFSTVVRPCLSDYRGWAIISGTSNGDDHFNELKKKNESDPSWDFFIIPVTETDALHPDEVIEMTKDMSPEEYAREMLCRFDAPVEGAYYAGLINKAEAEGRICGVPHDVNATVITWWDLGVDDECAIWFHQLVGKEYHIIDCIIDRGKGLDWYARAINGQEEGHEHRKAYVYGAHVCPHDIKAREISTAKTRMETLSSLLTAPIIVAPMHRVEDGISAVRSTLPLCWFDKERTEQGRSALRNYHKNMKTGQPVHNWASHPSDAFRTGAVSVNMFNSYGGNSRVVGIRSGPLRRNVGGVR